jgi:hypothetical protein
MDRCPPEICGEIYSFACLDDGRTGRSLSLVSKFTHETSKPYKLQSVSLIGHAQLYAFADLVERTPEHLRRVKCIFVSAHSRETAILPRTIAPEYHRRMDVYAAFKRILTAIAPCVQIVHVFFVFFRPFVLLPIGLPLLEELVIHGSLEPSTTLVDQNVQFPSLKHLWLTSSGSPTFLLQKVLPLAPTLHHLRLSEIKSEIHADEWKTVRTDPSSAFPAHLKRIIIHKPTDPKLGRRPYEIVMSELNELAEHDSRIVLLPPFKLDMFSMIELQAAEATYAASITGVLWW